MDSNNHIIDIVKIDKIVNANANNLEDQTFMLDRNIFGINENTPSNSSINENTPSNSNTINTDTESIDKEHNHTNISDVCYEFSISTLDRKLKEIKKLRNDKYKRNRINSISTYEESPIKISSYNNQEHTTGITIMMNPSKLISDHLKEIQLRIVGHTRAAKMYEKRDKIIGYPVTILSSFLTSAIMMSITNDNSNSKYVIKYISLTLSIMSFLFSVSRDYLNFSRKFQSHDLSSKLYTTLLRSTEVRLIKTHLNGVERRDIFKDIVDQMSIIEQYEKPIPAKIDNNVRKERELMSCPTEV